MASFAIKEPRDREAAAAMLRPEVGRFLSAPGDDSYARAKQSLEEAARGADYAPAVHTALGKYFGQPRYDPETKTFVARVREAERHFRSALQASDLDAVSEAQALKGWKETARQQGAAALEEQGDQLRRRLVGHADRDVILAWLDGGADEKRK